LDQSGAAVPKDADLFVYSEAIPESAPERRKAKEYGIRQISYPHALGELSKDHFVIAVCGSHGKSSTTAMAARLLIKAGKDPTVVVGTKMQELEGRNWRKGESNIFLLEACEYRRSFHFYSPNIILLTNCDGDHFDYFTSKEDYLQAFEDFIKKLPEDGVCITHAEDAECKEVVNRAQKPLKNADTFPLLTLKTPGLHMQKNAQLVLGLAEVLGMDGKQAEEIVSGYAGSWRRLEHKGFTKEGAIVIDDYGHHPVEIKASINAIRDAYPTSHLLCVFQPHTHDRTIKLYDDFITSFTEADEVIVTDVYDARPDVEKGIVDIEKFASDISKESKVPVVVKNSLKNVENYLREAALEKDDVLLILGAGDITNLASAMVAS
jgi:UDP-N-acetylmuramate--alanine ligase